MVSANQGKWALVTGASSGIGEAFSKRFAKEGWNVILVARSVEKLKALAGEFEAKHSVKTLVIESDLSKPNACQNIYENVKAKQIELGALVNNAGFGAVGEFLNIDLKKQLEMIDVNIRALLELTYLFLPGMSARREGLVINVSSTASFQPIPYFAVYSATKAFVTSFSEALWGEYKKQGIQIMNLCPGTTKTNFGVVAGKKEAVSDWRPGQTAEEVVEYAFRNMKRNVPTIVTNPFDNFLRFFSRLLSRRRIVTITEKVAKRMGYSE